MKKLFSNKKMVIAILAIALVVVFNCFIWGRALHFNKEIIALCDIDNSCSELSNMSDLYELPFKASLVFSLMVFSSAFLLTGAFRKRE